jgi:pimeloyl-ACP methyl ester carboxylesterase
MRRLILALLMFLSPAVGARAEEPWMTLPPTPTLPRATSSGVAPINGANIWYATFGAGEPILMLHGGLANSDYWGPQVRALARNHRVIVMDSRGHGRSSHDDKPFGYQLMADDAVGLLDRLGVSRVSLVGWSDGAIIGLDIAMRHPERLKRLFAFAANYNPDGVADIASSPVFTAYMARAGEEYARKSPTPKGYGDFRAAIEKMWET